MPIDRSFKTSWKKTGTHEGHAVWTSYQAQLGIHGTRVAVDFDECTGCLKCITICPEDVFAQWEAKSNQVKPDPKNESACLECLACELVCPVDAILITRDADGHDTLTALLE